MAMPNDKPLRSAAFSEVPVGGWFKESAGGTWHLKVSASKGAYQAWGTRYEPAFKADAQVFVE